MKRHIIFLMAALCVTLWIGLSTAAQKPEKEKAVFAAEKWLSLIDAGDYSKSWREASDYFRSAITEDKWEHSLKSARNPLGKLLSRKVKNTSYRTSLPGAPDGEYVVIQFETSFENKKSSIETVTPMLERDGSWRVSGYYVK
jgi:hypothetical protein